MTKGLVHVTPIDLAHRWGVTPMQVRRVLRSLYGTLKRKDRGSRWHLTPAEIALTLRRRKSGVGGRDLVLSDEAHRGRQGYGAEGPKRLIEPGSGGEGAEVKTSERCPTSVDNRGRASRDTFGPIIRPGV